MKNQTKSSILIRSILASPLILALSLAISIPAQAQSAAPAEAKPNPNAQVTEPSMAMMQHHQEMLADMKAQDAQLTEQVAAMNSAPEGKKLDLLAAIVTKMVEQRTAMTARMESMHDEMMKTMKPQMMKQQMQMDKAPVPKPPMMNGMKGMDDKPADAPNAR